MDKFRSRLSFWKKVESKKPPPESPTKKKATTSQASVSQSTPQLEPNVPPVSQPRPQVPVPRTVQNSQVPAERRSEQLGQSYPAKPLPRPQGDARKEVPQPQSYGAGVRASMPANVGRTVAAASQGGSRGSVPNARQMPLPTPPSNAKGPLPTVPQIRPQPAQTDNHPVQASSPSSALPPRTRASMPSPQGQMNAQQRQQMARKSVQPGNPPQTLARGQLPQPPTQQARQLPSVRGKPPPLRGQQPTQRGPARGPLPAPPVSRGPLPAPPGTATSPASPVAASKPAPIKAQVRTPQVVQNKPPVNAQRQSVQARANPAARYTAQQVQRQSMPRMGGEASTRTAQQSSVSSRPPNKPQPPVPSSVASTTPQKAQPKVPDTRQDAIEQKEQSKPAIKPLVIADIFKQEVGSEGLSDARKSRRERRGDAGDGEKLLQDIHVLARSQPPKNAPPPVPVKKQSSESSVTNAPHSTSDFFIPVASIKKEPSKHEDTEEDRPPTPPPRSPHGDRSHRSQRTAAPKLPSREPAGGEKRQTGFMSRIKSVFGSAPVLPAEEGTVMDSEPSAPSPAMSASQPVPSLGHLQPTATTHDSVSSVEALPQQQKEKSKKTKAPSKSKGKSVAQRASQASTKLSNSVHGVISPRGKNSAAAVTAGAVGAGAVGVSYGLNEKQQKSMKSEEQAEVLRQQLREIDDKIEANSRTKEGIQRMAEASASTDPMFDAQLMDLNTMLAQLMEARSRIASQLESIGSFAPKTPVLSPRGVQDEATGRARVSTANKGTMPTLIRAGSSASNLTAKYYRSNASYVAQHPQQLDIQVGDVMTVVWRAPTGWWKVSLNTVEGYVLSQYLDALPDDEGEKALAIQRARAPTPDPVQFPGERTSVSDDLKPLPYQPPVAKRPATEKRQTSKPSIVSKSESYVEPNSQRRMTMPLPEQPHIPIDTAGAAQNNREVASKPPAPAPKPQRPQFPQAKVMFAFEKSTPTEIGIEAGLQVSVIEVSGEWSYILHEPTSNAGYIPNSYLQSL